MDFFLEPNTARLAGLRKGGGLRVRGRGTGSCPWRGRRRRPGPSTRWPPPRPPPPRRKGGATIAACGGRCRLAHRTARGPGLPLSVSSRSGQHYNHHQPAAGLNPLGRSGVALYLSPSLRTLLPIDFYVLTMAERGEGIQIGRLPSQQPCWPAETRHRDEGYVKKSCVPVGKNSLKIKPGANPGPMNHQMAVAADQTATITDFFKNLITGLK